MVKIKPLQTSITIAQQLADRDAEFLRVGFWTGLFLGAGITLAIIGITILITSRKE